jgi:drug/metabolite transporter (DMT)-like permease
MGSLSPRAIGVTQILLSGVCFGFIGIFGKWAFASGLTPGELLSLRFLIAGLVMMLLIGGARGLQSLCLSRADLLWSIILGVFGYAVMSYCYFRALSGLSASLTVLLLYMYPLIVPIAGRIFLGEAIPHERLLALPVVMVGLVLLVWGDIEVREPVAIAFGIGSAVFYSIYILCSRRFLANADSLTASAYIQLGAGLAVGVFELRDHARVMHILQAAWPALAGLTLIGSVCAITLFNSGLKRLKSWEVSVLSTSEPVTAVFLAMVLLDERLSRQQWVGAVLVIISLLFVSLPVARPSRSR